MSKRFDRAKGNIKHHMMSLCAMNHMDYKKKYTNSYEQFLIFIFSYAKEGLGSCLQLTM